MAVCSALNDRSLEGDDGPRSRLRSPGRACEAGAAGALAAWGASRSQRLAVLLVAITAFLLLPAVAPAAPPDPWVITGPVTVTEPIAVGEVVVTGGGSLTVEGVPEPGFQITGNLTILDGTAVFRDSVIQVMSTYHGQYSVVTLASSQLTIERCDYRVPGGVQHGIVPAGTSRIEVRDSNFGSVQFVPAAHGTLVAERLNGMFECVLLDDARLELTDIPRDPGAGRLWVWPTFPAGSRCTYSPPLPGLVAGYDFPPAGCSGIAQSFSLRSTEVMLWPLLVRAGARLTLAEVAPENWMVVGLFVPADVTLAKLVNGRSYAARRLPLPDRTLRLVNATVDSWNFYPTGTARLELVDSVVGEVIADERSRVVLRRTTVDGSGGYFGAKGEARVRASRSRFTCDVQASGAARLRLRGSLVLPYPHDPTGAWTHLGAFDDAVIHLDRTDVAVTPALGGSGAFAVTRIDNVPRRPPPPRSPLTLRGTAAVYTLDPAGGMAAWRLAAVSAATGKARSLGSGAADVESGDLGTWRATDRAEDHDLRLRLTDARGRRFASRSRVPGVGTGK